MFGVIDPGLVGDAVVYTGGFPVRYGNRMGGVFDLSTVDVDHEPQSALGLSVFNAMGRNAGRLDNGNLDWLGAVRIGTLRPLVELAAKTRRARATRTSMRASGTASRIGCASRPTCCGRETSSASTARATARARRWKAAIATSGCARTATFGTNVEAALWLGHSTIDSFRKGSVDRDDIAVGAVNDHRSSEYRELLGRVAWQPGARHWLEGGFEWTDESAVYRYAANAAYTPAVAELFARDPTLLRETTLKPERERVALFAAYRWQIHRRADVRARASDPAHDHRGHDGRDWLFDPRLSLRYELTPAWELRAHWGRFHQTDEVHELKVEDGLTAFPEAQESDHFILGVDHRLRNGLALRAEWFRKFQRDPRPRFENLLDPLTVLPEIGPDRVEVAPNSAGVRGAEISVIAEGPT